MDKPKGIIIQGLVEGGAASESDLREGDVILEVDSREMNRPNQLQSYIASKTAGTTVTLKVFRDGEVFQRKVTLKARDEDSKTEPVVDKDPGKEKKESVTTTATFDEIGFSVKNLTDRDKSDFDLSNGVLITNVKPFSKAEDQRLFSGLVIVEADKNKINLSLIHI